LNPCGAVVDFIRRPYRVLARPFKDSDETAEMVWYPALPDAPTLPFPTVFNSLEWQPFPLNKTSAGEVPDVDRVFDAQGTKDGATGIHQCGSPESFLEGILYDPERFVEYNDDGLPVCCEGFIRGACGCGTGGALVTPPAVCNTCATPMLAELGTDYAGSFPPYCDHWYRFNGLDDGNYTLTIDYDPLPTSVDGTIWVGPICFDPIASYPLPDVPTSVTFAVTGGVVFVSQTAIGATPGSYTFRLDAD
jgi:hypothetical protein